MTFLLLTAAADVDETAALASLPLAGCGGGAGAAFGAVEWDLGAAFLDWDDLWAEGEQAATLGVWPRDVTKMDLPHSQLYLQPCGGALQSLA